MSKNLVRFLILISSVFCSSLAFSQSYTLVGEEYRDASEVLESIGVRSLIYKPPQVTQNRTDDRLFYTPFFVFKKSSNGKLDVKYQPPLPGTQKHRVILTLFISPQIKVRAMVDTIRSQERITQGAYSNLDSTKLIGLPLRNLMISNAETVQLFNEVKRDSFDTTSELPLTAELSNETEAKEFKRNLEDGTISLSFDVRFEVNAVFTQTESTGSLKGVVLYDTNAVKNLEGAGKAFDFNISPDGGSVNTNSSETYVTRDQKSTFEGRLQKEIGVFYDIENPADLSIIKGDLDKYFIAIFGEKEIQFDNNFEKELTKLSTYDFDARDIKPDEIKKLTTSLKDFFKSKDQEWNNTEVSLKVKVKLTGVDTDAKIKRELLKINLPKTLQKLR